MVIDPRGFSDDVIAWADQMGFLIERESDNFPRLDDPKEWREWAMCVYCSPDDIGQDAPDPEAYDTWQEWAMRLFATTNFEG